MSFIIATINIVNYSPSSFDFEDFKFIFSHNKRVFGDEISYISKNKIIQKVKLEQKDINFSVKVIKKDSLRGVCDFIIPYKSVLLKKITSYEKECIINMTDSTKRILSINNYNLKINIHCDIDYLEKEKKNGNNQKLLVNKNKNNTIDVNDSSAKKRFIYNKINNKNNKDNNININSKKNYNTIVYSKPRYFQNKKHSNSFDIEKNNNDLDDSDDIIIKNNNEDNNSFDTEEELNQNFNIIDTDFSNYIPNLIKEYPLENLSKMNDINEMMSFTKDNIIKFLNYQQEYNEKVKKSLDNYDKYYKLYKKYSQKYANKIKQMKFLEKKLKINEIKKSMNNNSFISNLSKIVDIKNSEIDLYELIRNDNDLEYDLEENLNINDINNYINKENKNYNVLNGLMTNCIAYYGNDQKINKIIPQNLIDNYNLNKNYKNYTKNNNIIKIEENILDVSLADNDENVSEEVMESSNGDDESKNQKLKYVISNVNDEIDYELDNYLKEICRNNKNIKINKFNKIHDNNYKYGDIQIIIIEEGDNIKIKDDKGIFPIEHFLEVNKDI